MPSLNRLAIRQEANCSKRKVEEVNCCKNIDVEVNCTKGKVEKVKCSKNIEEEANCSKASWWKPSVAKTWR